MVWMRSARPCLKLQEQRLTINGKKENYKHLPLLFRGYKHQQLKPALSNVVSLLWSNLVRFKAKSGWKWHERKKKDRERVNKRQRRAADSHSKEREKEGEEEEKESRRLLPKYYVCLSLCVCERAYLHWISGGCKRAWKKRASRTKWWKYIKGNERERSSFLKKISQKICLRNWGTFFHSRAKGRLILFAMQIIFFFPYISCNSLSVLVIIENDSWWLFQLMGKREKGLELISLSNIYQLYSLKVGVYDWGFEHMCARKMKLHFPPFSVLTTFDKKKFR